MAKAGLKSKNEYQKSIWKYHLRRESYKAKYGKTSETYLKLSRSIQLKLDTWKKAIKRIEIRDNLIKEIDDNITEFIGKSPYKSIHSTDQLTIVAKNIFFKYGIENGISGVYLADYAGLKYRIDASRYRLQFTRSFKTNKYNLEMWHRFKDYLNNSTLKIAA